MILYQHLIWFKGIIPSSPSLTEVEVIRSKHTIQIEFIDNYKCIKWISIEQVLELYNPVLQQVFPVQHGHNFNGLVKCGLIIGFHN